MSVAIGNLSEDEIKSIVQDFGPVVTETLQSIAVVALLSEGPEAFLKHMLDVNSDIIRDLNEAGDPDHQVEVYMPFLMQMSLLSAMIDNESDV